MSSERINWRKSAILEKNKFYVMEKSIRIFLQTTIIVQD